MPYGDPTYIHELLGWPHLRWDDASIATPLARVRHEQGRLLGRMAALGFDTRDTAGLDALTADALKTSEIEGERLDPAQVRSSVARRLGLDEGGVPVVDRRVEGVVEMLVNATRHHAEPLTAERLFRWHAALFPTGWSQGRRVHVGAWRDAAAGPMQVVSGPVGGERVHFEAPHANRLSVEMAAFLDWFEQDQRLDPVLKASVAHLWFLTIHPFDDGNGRIARAIADLQLARSEQSPQRFYSLSSQIGVDRDDYYDVLERTQRGSLDITAWHLWFLGCLGRAIAQADSLLADVLRRAAFWDTVRDLRLNTRQRAMLARLLAGFEGKLTSSKWALLMKCSQDTASRDIAELVELGVLVKEAAGGRSTSYALASAAGP